MGPRWEDSSNEIWYWSECADWYLRVRPLTPAEIDAACAVMARWDAGDRATVAAQPAIVAEAPAPARGSPDEPTHHLGKGTRWVKSTPTPPDSGVGTAIATSKGTPARKAAQGSLF